jgi:adenylylsulfate kinase-like enzyme
MVADSFLSFNWLEQDLGFSAKDREENIRRIGEVCLSPSHERFVRNLKLNDRLDSFLFAGLASILPVFLHHRYCFHLPLFVYLTLLKLLSLLSFLPSSHRFLSPFLSLPDQADRDLARSLHEAASPAIPFIEVFVDAPLSVVEARDPKGLYKKARAGEIKDFTGISAPYEAPAKPEITIKTDEVDVEGAVKQITEYLIEKGLVKL